MSLLCYEMNVMSKRYTAKLPNRVCYVSVFEGDAESRADFLVAVSDGDFSDP